MRTIAMVRASATIVSVMALAGLAVRVGQASPPDAASAASTATATPLDLAPARANTVQVTLTVWGTRRGTGSTALVTLYKEHVAFDLAGNKAFAEQFDMAALPGKRPERPSMLVIDGTNEYDMIGALEKFTKSAAEPIRWGIGSRLFPGGLTDAVGWGKPAYQPAPDETLEDGRKLKVYVSEGETKRGEGPDALTYRIVTKLWIDPATRLPVRSSASSKLAGSEEPLREFQRVDFADWKLDQPIDAGRFVWVVPEGASELKVEGGKQAAGGK